MRLAGTLRAMTRDDLIAGFTAAAECDPAVQALLLGGSLGRGEGDAWSDVDLIAVTDGADHGAFVQDLLGWASGIAKPVLWRQVHPPWPLYHAVTAGYLRYDITVTTADRVQESADRVRPLVDKAGVHASLPAARERPPVPPSAVHRLAEEFLRILGLLPVALGRCEYVSAVSGLGLLRQQLQDLMVLEQRPVSPPGALSLARCLPPEDLRTLARLSVTQPDHEAILQANLDLAAAFLPRARVFAAHAGAAWPEALEAAVRARLVRDLGVEIA